MRVLVVCIVLDASLIAVHLFRAIAGDVLGPESLLRSERWSLLADRSIAEFYGYLKVLLAAACLIATWRSTRQAIYLSWAVVLTIVVMDDAFMVHENLGVWLSPFDPDQTIAGLPADHFGELVTWGLMGIVALAALYAGFRASIPDESRWTLAIAASFAGLIFFAVIVDIFAVGLKGIVRGVGMIEDGGELVMMSLMLFAAVTIMRNRPATSSAD